MMAPTRPIRSDSAWLLLKPGTRRKMRGVMLLYPDKLVGVPVALEYWGIVLGGLIAGLAYPSTRLGGMVSIGTMVVTTADGAEYGFRVRGLSGSMQASLAAALTRLGREVRATTGGLTITPDPAGDGA